MGTAGVAEHLLMYPFDTIKTNLQALPPCASAGTSLSSTASSPAPAGGGVSAATSSSSAASSSATGTGTVRGTYQNIVRQDGLKGLYRGVSAMAAGCVPAHIAFFCTYEVTKNMILTETSSGGSSSSSSSQPPGNTNGGGNVWLAGTVAGAAGTLAHDIILTPLDVAKQRMQLGANRNCYGCVKHVCRTEGYMALYRSFPITIMSNAPFGAILTGVNERLKEMSGLSEPCKTSEEMNRKLPLYFSTAGFSAAVAALVTQPLDVLKTRLQTQDCLSKSNPISEPRYRDVVQAASRILREEGYRAFYRGTIARCLVVIPSGGVSWASYELVKSFLVRNC